MIDFFSNHAESVPLMAILRGFDTSRTIELCHRAWDCGVELVEIPIQSPAAVEALRAAADAAAGRGALVGAGTVTSRRRVQEALGAGAAFTVAPGLDPEVVAGSRDVGLPHLPGVATASDVHLALKLEQIWLKAFPADLLGVGWPKAMHGPFPEARFVATGGVTIANAEAHLQGGAAMCALGSALADDDQFALLPGLVERLRRRRPA
jgi:2-dehydro-3-deoxyphosphogluconate aldolase/(4S)-4-hydroxy-2-oxoglutarate aldolase